MKNLIRAAVILPTLLTAQSGPDVVERTSESTVAVLVGLGAGRMTGMASGAIVKPDGVILTAYHVIQNAKEVQIRMKNGDVYDRVELIGFDERRDVAALRIPAHNLRALAAGAGLEVRPGETAIVVANGNGLTWTASEGIFSAIRPA